MKSLILIFTALSIVSCSFDNKTGIWQDASNMSIENQNSKSINNNNLGSKYEEILEQKKIFSEEKVSLNSSNFTLEPPIRIDNWLEQYATFNNNISNYFYNGNKKIISKGPKLNKNNLNTNIIFYDNYLITHDHKGKIFIYSINSKKKYLNLIFIKKNLKILKKIFF